MLRVAPDSTGLIDSDAIAEFATVIRLSQNQTRAIGVFLAENKVQVEVGLRRELVARNHLLDPFMEVKRLHFLINGKMIEKQTVVVKDASETVMHVFDLRKQNPQDFIVKVYFDNGGEYLKLSCSLIPKKGVYVPHKKGIPIHLNLTTVRARF